jgi:hypothetical protein
MARGLVTEMIFSLVIFKTTCKLYLFCSVKIVWSLDIK